MSERALTPLPVSALPADDEPTPQWAADILTRHDWKPVPTSKIAWQRPDFGAVTWKQALDLSCRKYVKPGYRSTEFLVAAGGALMLVLPLVNVDAIGEAVSVGDWSGAAKILGSAAMTAIVIWFRTKRAEKKDGAP